MTFVIYGAITAVIEFILLMTFRDRLNAHREDPDALSYTAHKDLDESIGYFPGKTYYDEKSKRFVTMYRYKWEYMGKKHTMMTVDNPFDQWEHYLPNFPEEITITISKKTGKLYKDKGKKKVLRKYLLTLLAAMILGAIVTAIIL